MKLATKIYLIVVIASLISFSIIMFFVSSFARDFLQNSIGQRQLEQGKLLMIQIDEMLYDKHKEISSFSKNYYVIDYLSGNYEKYANTDFKNLIEDPEVLDKVIVLKKDELSDNNTVFKDALSAVKEGKNYYSDVSVAADGLPIVIFADPVYTNGDNHTVQGAILATMSWDKFNSFLKMENGSYIDLYNKNGIRIASNQNVTLNIKFDQDNTYIRQLIGKVTNGSFLGVENNLSGNGKSLISISKEQGYEDYSGNGWYLIIETPDKVAFAPVTQNVFRVSLIVVTILAFMMFATIFFIRRFIERPITKLYDAVIAYTAGDFSHRAKILSDDEIGKLGKSFNNMAEKLQSVYSGLESQVLEKTKELNKRLKETESSNVDLSNARKALLNVSEDLNLEKNKLEDLYAKNKAIFEAISEGVFVVDTNGKIVMVDKAFEDILGWRFKEVFNKDFYEKIPMLDGEGKLIPREKRLIITCIKSAKTVSTISGYKDYFVTKAGLKIPIAAKSSPIFLRGQIIGAVCDFRNVSKEKELDELKSEFLSVAAHQLRTPLGAMRWNTEMLLDGDFGKLPKSAREALETIHLRNLSMIALVNDLLNVSRIDQNRTIDEPTSTDVVSIAKNVIGDLIPLTEKKAIKINLDYGDLPKTMIDQKKLHQVFENMIINSINYSRKGGKVNIAISKFGAYIKIDVIDSGIGIPESDKHKIFGKFFRARNALKSATEGTGLGLFVVKSYVKKWGGRIWFESREGKGTTFHITIPIKSK